MVEEFKGEVGLVFDPAVVVGCAVTFVCGVEVAKFVGSLAGSGLFGSTGLYTGPALPVCVSVSAGDSFAGELDGFCPDARETGTADGALPVRSGLIGGCPTSVDPFEIVGSVDTVGCAPLGTEVLAGSTLATGAPIFVGGMADFIAGDLKGDGESN